MNALSLCRYCYIFASKNQISLLLLR